MSEYIRIKPYFSVIAHDPNCVELRAGVWNHISFRIEDNTNSDVLLNFIQALDGTRTLRDICKQRAISRSTAEGVLDQLKQLNVIENGPSSALDYYTDLFTPAFKTKQRTEQEVINHKVYLIADDNLADDICEMLINKTPIFNLDVISDKHDIYKLLNEPDEVWLNNAVLFEERVQQFNFLSDSFVIVALSQINPLFFKKFNRIATALTIPWIHAATDGPFIFIGPIFEPQQTACYECFETRVSMNLREYQAYQKYKNAIAEYKIIKHAEFPVSRMINSILSSHLIMEVFNYLLTHCGFTKNKVLSIYLPTMEIIFNEFLKVSTCKNCGSEPSKENYQLYFDLQALLGELHA